MTVAYEPLLLWGNIDDALLKLKTSVFNGLLPSSWHPLATILLGVTLLLGSFATLFALITLLERKGLGRIQNRPGPNRVGLYGILQPAADGIKMLIKEDIVPASADKVVHFLAPLVLLAPVTLALAAIPYGKYLTPAPMEAGLLFFFAVSSSAELAAFMAGWSSRNKYSLLGAMRAVAQMISFELPLVASTIPVAMLAGTISLGGIVEAQSGSFFQWHIFTPWGLAAFLLFMTAAAAEANRSPFDLPEGESEIIGGFMTEYSGFKYAVFFMGEYFGMFALNGLAITLFLGGWHAPFTFLEFIPSFAWFLLKLLALVFGFIWIRGTFPRLRSDQLMNFAWKWLLPLALLNIVVAISWHWMGAWKFPGAMGLRWGLCFLALFAAFCGIGRLMMQRKNWGPRIYRYAN